MPRALLILLTTCISAVADMPAIIPMPREVWESQGTFEFGPEVRIKAEVPADPARLVTVMRDSGLKAVCAIDTANIVIRRGEVKNPHGFAGAIHAAETLRQWLRPNKSFSRFPTAKATGNGCSPSSPLAIPRDCVIPIN